MPNVISSGLLYLPVANTLTITTTSPLPNGTTGAAYSTTVAATGGTAPYTWSITADSPDSGSWLSINSSTGVLSGTPSVAETESVTVKVTDANNLSFSRTFALTVNAASAAHVKWNPGHYAATNNYAGPNAGGQKLAAKQAEIAIARASAQYGCLGYQGSFYANSFLNATAGSYDFDWLDYDYVQCLTGSTTWTPGNSMPALNNPIKYGIYIQWADYFSVDPRYAVPLCLLEDSECGACPVASDLKTPANFVSGYHGWWVGNYGTQAEVALWRPYVMSTYIVPFFQALAAHVLPDGYTVANSPYIQTIWPHLETATVPSNVNAQANDSTYSGSALISAYQTLNAAGKTAFPTTNFCCTCNNTADAYNDDVTAAGIIQTLLGTRTAESGPDTFGYSSGQGVGNGLSALTPGQYSYIGNTIGGVGGTDYRGKIPAILMVQGTELGYQAVYTAADIFEQANTTLHASEIWWTILQAIATPDGTSDGCWYGPAYSNPSSWTTSTGGVLGVIHNNPLTNGTSYPSGYP